MSAAGVKLGLPRDVAKQLAEQTALGAAHMAVASSLRIWIHSICS